MAIALCIVGDSRSGSTLLQGLLSRHPQIAAAGEIRRLEDGLEKGRLCFCGAKLAACEHWQRVLAQAGMTASHVVTQRPASRLQQRFEEAAGLLSVTLRMQALGRWLLPQGRRVADCVGRLHAANAQISGVQAVVDCSKDPGHLVYLMHQQHVVVRPVFCIRDGRGTVHSKMARGLSAEVATRNWTHIVRATLWLRRVLGAKRSDWITYESLCRDPDRVVGGIVAAAGLTPAALSTADNKPRHYGVELRNGVEPRTFSMERIEEDVRWRTQMTPEDLAVFERIAGPLNRSLGYR